MTDMRCSCCGNPMSADGAIILSPPTNGGTVHKYWICTTCWVAVSKLVGEKK